MSDRLTTEPKSAQPKTYDSIEEAAKNLNTSRDDAPTAGVDDTVDPDHPNLFTEGDHKDLLDSDQPGDGSPAGEAGAEAGDGSPAGEPGEINEYLLEQAHDFGIPIEEAEAMGEKALTAMLRAMKRSAQEEPEAPRQDQPLTEEQQRLLEEDKRFAEKFGLEFPDRDDLGETVEYNPHIRKAVEAMNDHYFELSRRQQAMLDDLHDRLADREAAEEERIVLEMQDKFDKAISDLGPEYEELLGKGNVSEIDHNSKGFRNRTKLLDEIAVLDRVRLEKGLPRLSMPEYLDRALSAVFKTNEETRAMRKVKAKAQKVQGALSAPPSQRKTAKKVESPTKEAVKAVRAKMKEHGMEPGPETKEDFFSD